MQLIKWIVKALYTITGAQAVAGYIESKITHYRIRLNIVPTSYKIFVYAIGLTTGITGTFLTMEYQKAADSWTFENPVTIEAAKVETITIEPEWQTAEFSAYTASVDETDASPLIMASGKMVYIGAIACPRSMKLGTVIELKTGERFTCEDRMNQRYQNHFDIFMLTKQEAKQFGRKQLEYRAI